MKLSLCMPWRHICENGGIASVILNLGTLPTLCVGERASETHLTGVWLWPKVSFDVNWMRICILLYLCTTSCSLAKYKAQEIMGGGGDSVVKFRY